MTISRTFLVLPSFLLGAAALYGAPVTWYLKDVALTGGGSLTGNITYDHDTHVLSSWYITSSPGSPDINCPANGCVWTSATDANTIFGIGVVADTPTFTSFALGTINNESLLIALAGQLTDAGGTVQMVGLAPNGCHEGNPANPGCVLNGNGPTGADLTGSLTTTPPAPGLQFYPVAPCRLVDTRVSSFQSGFGPPSMGAGTTRTFPILSNIACGVRLTAAAYSLNVTAVTKGYLGALTIWPAGQPIPNASTLNSYSTSGTAVANAAIVPAGTGGAINVYTTDATDLVIDINGYFDLPLSSGLDFYPVTPCRLVDTRVTAEQSGFGPPSMIAGMTRPFSIPSNTACGIPATAAAYSLNVTAVPRSTLGFLSIWPAGTPMPNVSTLNVYTAGTVVANAAIVPAGSGGAINAFVTDATDLVIDINGYFGPMSPTGLKFYAVTPCRVADTRVASFPSGLGPPAMSAQTQRSFAVPASTCGIPPSARAYSFNFTAVPLAPQLGIFTTWPTGQPQPNVSTMNSYNGSVVANAAIVPAGANGAISVYVTDLTNVLFDINGYFAQ